MVSHPRFTHTILGPDYKRSHPYQRFRTWAPTKGQPPYHLALDAILPADSIGGIKEAKLLVLHMAGDTGGVKSPQPQHLVSTHMEDDLRNSPTRAKPAFFYHLGDVVYFHGEPQGYFDQFYEPYEHYELPILGIPGNHDGESEPSLEGFIENFCSPEPQLSPQAGHTTRETMIQPNVYWTLQTPFATMIGLYTNVPEGGELADDQKDWLRQELAEAPTDRALLVAMHHPIFSIDRFHGPSEYMGGVLDAAIQGANRIPDAVFAGHVHNYQRFTRNYQNREIPYIVAGAGGYWNLHKVETQDRETVTTPYIFPGTDAILQAYCDDHHGFLRLEISQNTLIGKYFTVPRPQESWSQPAECIDSFVLDLKNHALSRA